MTIQADDEAEILRLDSAWNDAYVRRDRSPLIAILADDFTGLTPSGEPITKAMLTIDRLGGVVKSVAFSEQEVRVFGDAAISRGRLKLEMDVLRLDQQFLRLREARRNMAGSGGVGHSCS